VVDALPDHHRGHRVGLLGHRVGLLGHRVGLLGHHRARRDVRGPHQALTRGDHHPSEDDGPPGAGRSDDQWDHRSVALSDDRPGREAVGSACRNGRQGGREAVESACQTTTTEASSPRAARRGRSGQRPWPPGRARSGCHWPGCRRQHRPRRSARAATQVAAWVVPKIHWTR